MKHLNNNTNDDDNNNTDDTYDETYDSKIRDKISDIRMILNRLGVIVTKKDKKKFKKSFMKQKKSKTFQIRKEKRFMIILSR